MDKISAMSNPRKGNGDLGNFYCANCGSSSGAYIQLKEKEIIYVYLVILSKTLTADTYGTSFADYAEK